MKVLIGGYTKHDSKGIYELDFSGENETARLDEAKNIIEVSGPTYFRKDGNLIFAINKPNNNEGGISVFKLNNGQYEEVETYLTPGSSPAYVGINRERHLLYTANYHTGIISVFSYDENGKLTLLDTDTHTAKTLGPRPEQVDGAHPHFFDETPAGNLVCCDLGNDTVEFYRLNDENKLEHLATYKNEAGFGDRHIVFSKDGNYFYVAGELSSKINVVKFNENTWEFEDIATYSTIPVDWDKHNGAAAIRISNDGRFIYVSNRGNDSITVFAVNEDHTLKLLQRISVFGEFPRDFNWDDSEKYVVVANQNTNNATLYLRSSEDGMLTPIQHDIEIPEGTCVVFSN
ncbi:lactonase family protein [Lactobacillus hamsteri]|uniref:PTS family maltose glucose porter, IIABC component n=1 Tax=Lactobacillus hamsteri DSM 5661 = JCM 6256 TaxID=1423754 RepID=A0A0R1YJS9_9LACO|nr:lactonase family protein [Lactobacillus hamsteri]KRM41140.1 PTS family maltose glucose porter, IIABC component [Lactobacillus hamsteri DSM 5661 = JCM 6256]